MQRRTFICLAGSLAPMDGDWASNSAMERGKLRLFCLLSHFASRNSEQYFTVLATTSCFLWTSFQSAHEYFPLIFRLPSSSQVDPLQCFRLSRDYYDRIVEYYQKKKKETRWRHVTLLCTKWSVWKTRQVVKHLHLPRERSRLLAVKVCCFSWTGHPLTTCRMTVTWRAAENSSWLDP